MKKLMNAVWTLRIWKDTKGQDLVEYALMAGFVAVAAGAIMPNISTAIGTIFNKIDTLLNQAAAS
jgi:pilus assembly protein Flp/PilA